MLEKMSFQNSARLQLLLAIVLVISQIGNCEERRNKNFAASLCGCHELQSLQEIRYIFNLFVKRKKERNT
jgi:hypothetical protein